MQLNGCNEEIWASAWATYARYRNRNVLLLPLKREPSQMRWYGRNVQHSAFEIAMLTHLAKRKKIYQWFALVRSARLFCNPTRILFILMLVLKLIPRNRAMVLDFTLRVSVSMRWLRLPSTWFNSAMWRSITHFMCILTLYSSRYFIISLLDSVHSWASIISSDFCPSFSCHYLNRMYSFSFVPPASCSLNLNRLFILFSRALALTTNSLSFQCPASLLTLLQSTEMLVTEIK